MSSEAWWPPREGQRWTDGLTGKAGEIVHVDTEEQTAVLQMEQIRLKDKPTTSVKWKTLAQRWSITLPTGQARLLDRNAIRMLR